MSFFSSVGVIKSSKETNSEFEKSIPKSSRLTSSVPPDEGLGVGVGIEASKSLIKELKSISSVKFDKSGISKPAGSSSKDLFFVSSINSWLSLISSFFASITFSSNWFSNALKSNPSISDAKFSISKSLAFTCASEEISSSIVSVDSAGISGISGLSVSKLFKTGESVGISTELSTVFSTISVSCSCGEFSIISWK